MAFSAAHHHIQALINPKLTPTDNKYSKDGFFKSIAFPPSRTMKKTKRVFSVSADSEWTIVGIDLGTTNSAVAAFLPEWSPTIIPNSHGQRTTPSVVAYTEDGKLLVGESAKRQAILNPHNTFFSFKRFIGRKMSEIDDESKQLPYSVVADAEGNIKLECPAIGKQFTAEEIAAEVLKKLVDDASKFTNERVTSAYIAVPAYFGDDQRTAIRKAAQMAGLRMVLITYEPVAAALGYWFRRKLDKTILAIDLGGGTFDVTVLEFGHGVSEVLSVSGDAHLGGDDFDKKIVDWLALSFKEEEGIDLLKDKQALQRLTMAAEKAKIRLSYWPRAYIRIPSIVITEDGHKDIKVYLTRTKFEELCVDLLDRLKTPIENALTDANLSFEDVDDVILVGGSTAMPAVQEFVKTLTGKVPFVMPNPEEVVALGAASEIRGVCFGKVEDIVLLDIAHLSIGLETLGGFMTKIIPMITSLPTSKSQVFTTATDGQTSIEINVLQGEREFARDNKSVGRFILDGISPSPRGVPQIEVRFDFDANGILSVVAVDKISGKNQNITIADTCKVPPMDEWKRMMYDAEEFAEEDKKKRSLIESQTDKLPENSGDKLPVCFKEKVPTV